MIECRFPELKMDCPFIPNEMALRDNGGYETCCHCLLGTIKELNEQKSRRNMLCNTRAKIIIEKNEAIDKLQYQVKSFERYLKEKNLYNDYYSIWLKIPIVKKVLTQKHSPILHQNWRRGIENQLLNGKGKLIYR